MTNILCRYLNRLNTSVIGISSLRYSSSCDQLISRSKLPPCYQPLMNFYPPILSNSQPSSRLAAKPSTVDLSFPQTIKEIIDNPINIHIHIIEPKIKAPLSIDDNIPQTSLNLPTISNNVEKHAIRMIVIRRKKMKKHKKKKLQKRMKFVLRRIKQRRELAKEKAFKQELNDQIRLAEQFDAKAYVASRLEILDKVRLPNKWRGEILPEAMIKEFIQEKLAKKERKKKTKERLTL